MGATPYRALAGRASLADRQARGRSSRSILAWGWAMHVGAESYPSWPVPL